MVASEPRKNLLGNTKTKFTIPLFSGSNYKKSPSLSHMHHLNRFFVISKVRHSKTFRTQKADIAHTPVCALAYTH